jgi:hypothetical protein
MALLDSLAVAPEDDGHRAVMPETIFRGSAISRSSGRWPFPILGRTRSCRTAHHIDGKSTISEEERNSEARRARQAAIVVGSGSGVEMSGVQNGGGHASRRGADRPRRAPRRDIRTSRGRSRTEWPWRADIGGDCVAWSPALRQEHPLDCAEEHDDVGQSGS